MNNMVPHCQGCDQQNWNLEMEGDAVRRVAVREGEKSVTDTEMLDRHSMYAICNNCGNRVSNEPARLIWLNC
jgi:hypothetical protein